MFGPSMMTVRRARSPMACRTAVKRHRRLRQSECPGTNRAWTREMTDVGTDGRKHGMTAVDGSRMPIAASAAQAVIATQCERTEDADVDVSVAVKIPNQAWGKARPHPSNAHRRHPSP